MVEQAVRVLKIDKMKVILIYSFINIKKFDRNHFNSTLLRIKNGFSQTDFIIGYFGRLTRQKQPWHVVNIAKLLSKKSDKFKFIIVGKGLFRNRLKNTIKKYKLQKSVHLLGYREDVPELMSIIDIGIFTSFYEGFPVSAIEMMAMEKPIIAFHIPAFEEIIEDGVNGYMINMGDIKGFSNKLSDICNDKNRLKKLGERAVEKIKPFDIQIAYIKYIDLYKKLG
jgi:glycosyltransferase EpsD